jgi:uncharacterized Zn-binding protein involved in type VI secretion
MSLERAARLYDPITHSEASEGRFLAETAVSVGLLFVPGPEEFVVAEYVYRGGSVFLRWAVRKIIKAVNKKAAELPGEIAEKVGGAIGAKVGETQLTIAGHIVSGSDDVTTNQRKAARVDDKVNCDDSTIAMGSDCVTIDRKPAARRGDPTKCGGHIADGSEDVLMGGVPVAEVGGAMGKMPEEKHDGVPWWAKALKSLGVGSAKGGVKEGVKDAVKDAAMDQAKERLKKIWGSE